MWLVALFAVVAIAALPAYLNRQISISHSDRATPAPVDHDFERRDALVAFWEGAVRENHPGDMFSPRQLAAQYLQRYRETGDIDDLLRAEKMARRSLAVQPQNVTATGEIAAVMLAFHNFAAAQREVEKNIAYDPTGPEFLSQEASLQMERGHYEAARATLARIDVARQSSSEAETVRSRYEELTGHLPEARDLLDLAMRDFDANAGASAQSRAWYHFRSGELAFEAGANDEAIQDERDALAMFPTYNLALKDLAKFELANHRYREALDAAKAGAAVTPFPETLGYEADAEQALGDPAGAAATRDLIYAIERIGNAYRVNDRLLAIYYDDHGVRGPTAFKIALREVHARGDEIYAQDTLAWAAAAIGKWAIARSASARALRFGTEDPILWFHAGMIHAHFGLRADAIAELRRALSLNPNFHARYADVARQMLGTLSQ
jgi:tetratricopeptide (TPR) repeat protein